MKKLFIVLLLALTLTACKPSEDTTTPEVLKYVVTVSNNNVESSYEIEKGKTFNFSILQSQNTNEYFEYWYYVSNDQEVKVIGDIQINSDIKIIAKYSHFYTVTIKYDKVELELYFKGNETLKFSDLPTSSSDAFKHWYYVSNGSEVIVTSDITITSDLTIIAKYEGSTGTLPWV